MYLPSIAFSQTNFNEDVLITEYFPLSKKNQYGVIIPSYNNGAVSVVFQDLMKRYPFIQQNCITNKPNDERLLTREEYEEDLNNLVNFMSERHGGRVRFVIKDIDEMYKLYVSVNSTKTAMGIINISKYSMMCPVTDTLAVPPEAAVTVIGIETFAAAIKRNMPFLELDLYTLNNMYQIYLKAMRSDPSSAIEIPSLITCPDLKSLVNLIGRCGDGVTEQMIQDCVIDGTADDNVLTPYYDRVQKVLGVRERVAKALLMYHPTYIEKTINGAKKHIGVLSDGIDSSSRPVVWYRSKQHTTQQVNKSLM